MSVGQRWRDVLSEREAEVVELLAQGKSNKEIGLELYVVEATVKWHIQNARRKIGSSSEGRVALARWWWQNVEVPVLVERTNGGYENGKTDADYDDPPAP